MEKPICYILSGLCADERVFDQIDFGSYAPIFIPWEKVDSQQSLESYVNQLSRQVHATNPILIGISFGGIVAQEMSLLFQNCPVLIISSIKTRSELPFFMRFSGKIGLNKLIPTKTIFKLKRLNYWFFGTKIAAEKQVLEDILSDSDPKLAKWAVGQIVHWKRTKPVPAKILHIHGDNDRIFNISNTSPDFIVQGGTHLMTVSKPEEVSSLIQKALETLSNPEIAPFITKKDF
jgi:pimeloyl-ACP methyl ester carboxylesterase